MFLPIKLLKQQHLPAGVRRAKRVTPTQETVIRQGWRQHPIYGPVRDNRSPVGFVDLRNFQLRKDPPSVRKIVEEVRARHGKNAPLYAGNMLYQDYRFFVGAKNAASQFSRCRACRAVLTGVKDRKNHIERNKCSYWLVEAYKLLLMRKDALAQLPVTIKQCAICGSSQTGERWGVPLCSERCIERWMFDDEAPSAALTAALVLTWDSVKGAVEASRREFDAGR